MKAVMAGFAGLLRFKGRDPNGRFWPYAIAIVILLFIGSAAVMLPFMTDTFARMQAFAAAHPDQATVGQTPTSYSIQINGYHPELMPDLSSLVEAFAIGAAFAVMLLAAAVVRRLHDSDRTGLWGLMPLPFLAIGMMLISKVFASFSSGKPDFRLFGWLFANNLTYLASLALLIVMLVSPSTLGPNRFGSSSSD